MPNGLSEDSRIISLNNSLPLYQDLEEDPKCHLKCEEVGARTPASHVHGEAHFISPWTDRVLTKNEASAPKSNAKCILEKV